MELIWELWEAGDWVVDLGKEGTEGAVLGHCSGQALCVIGKVSSAREGETGLERVWLYGRVEGCLMWSDAEG